ncbi:FAD-dependent thymidylate synthase [Bradyrhizobium sp. SZCCHNS3053]|uniref:FAD-dependent thymidylate synthase n=1 Tax=Bradyrhizobium sp. SZCCHNS3053 TaxID=3057322 RepID=UPI002915FA9A|nr:FAD-dependent thymidylate synthase [Bradyrhizobium sp. SZCCHNS3053]
MTISAKKIKHSISPRGKELKTALLRYPRFIHAEELTHRILSTSPDEIIVQTIADGLMYDRNLSRNASSSRAIPVHRLIDDILRDTAMPIHWGKNQKGMQAHEEHDALIKIDGWFGDRLDNPRYGLATPEEAWLTARDNAITIARAYDEAGYHKQVVNRLLEPFAHINVLVTATEWDNFFELRDHEDAQPEIKALAVAMKEAFAGSEPELLQPGQWHLPFVTEYEMEHLELQTQIKISVARCARTSYLTHEGKMPLIMKDLQLFNDLVGARPLHASPAEHQATPDTGGVCVDASEGPSKRKPFWQWDKPNLHGNFVGWIQNRKLIEQEIYAKAA